MNGSEPKRSRGRPARLSSDAIVEAALSLLETGTMGDLTLSRIAESLGVSTMSLYTYFASRDALLEAVAAQAFSRLELPARGRRWQDNLLAWLWAVQGHFDRHPVVAKTMGWEGRVPAAWLHVSAPIIEEFQRLGFAGERLAFALNWFMSSAIGLMLVELAAPVYRSEPPAELLARLPPSEQDLFAMAWAPVDREALLEFGFRRLVDGVQALRREA